MKISAFSTYCLLASLTLCQSFSWAQGFVIDNGSTTNKWILHNPEDSRKTLFLAPLYNGVWDFSQQTQFRPNGDVNFSGKIAIGTNASESATSRLRVYNGGTVLGSSTVSHNTDGYLSLGNADISSTPTIQTWGSATTLLLTNQDYSAIGFHDANNRVDFIRAGNGMIQLGYDGGFGPAHIGLPNGVWNTAGNVGIGNANPASRVHVTGGGLVLGTNATQRNTDGYLSIGDTQTNSTPNAQNWISETSLLLNAQDYTTIGFHDAGQRVDFIRSGNGTIQVGYDGGWGPANVGLPSGVWNSSGNVGIGTTNPGAYKLAVEGKIGAREVEVKTGSWADFVFKDDYKLRPIEEVEKYIAANSHLPEIPSEEKVKAEGVNLGEMNVKLLQKIEELTLYLIQQQKQIQTLNNEVKLLKANK